jgi:hypothetical protein
MITRDLFLESGSTEATKINKILQRYVIYISDQITVLYLNIETGNRRLNIDGWYVFALKIFIFSSRIPCKQLTLPGQTATSVFENCPVVHCVYRFVMVVRKNVLEYIIALVVVKKKSTVKKVIFSHYLMK